MDNNSQYTILQADVLLSGAAESKPLDIRTNIIELKFFENLAKPYVDARMLLMDDFGFKTSLQIQGVERIRLVVGTGARPEQPAFVKYFFISRILDTQKAGDRAELLSIELVEEHVYVNALKSMSRSYEGALEDIVTRIFDNDLKKEVIPPTIESSQGTRKIIVPYMSPMEASQWILSRASTSNGAPYFITGDLYSDKIRIRELESMMSAPVINPDLPFRKSEAIAMADIREEFKRPYYEINDVVEIESENSLKLYEEGAIGSFYESIDANSGLTTGAHISVRDILTEMYLSGMIDNSATQSLFDPSLEIDGRLSDEYNSLFVHQVVSRNTYNQYNSYHDEAVLLDEDNNIFESKLKIKNRIMRHLMRKNRIEVRMSGMSLFRGQISPGSKIRMLFLNPNLNSSDQNIEDQIDFRKSGDYLLTATNHTLAQEVHSCVLRLSKLSDLPKDVRLNI